MRRAQANGVLKVRHVNRLPGVGAEEFVGVLPTGEVTGRHGADVGVGDVVLEGLRPGELGQPETPAIAW